MDEFEEMFVRLEYKDDNSFFTMGPQDAEDVNNIRTLHDNISVSLADEFVDLMQKKYPENISKPSYSVIEREFREFLATK